MKEWTTEDPGIIFDDTNSTECRGRTELMNGTGSGPRGTSFYESTSVNKSTRDTGWGERENSLLEELKPVGISHLA
jgi:hypothetical protein